MGWDSCESRGAEEEAGEDEGVRRRGRGDNICVGGLDHVTQSNISDDVIVNPSRHVGGFLIIL